MDNLPAVPFPAPGPLLDFLLKLRAASGSKDHPDLPPGLTPILLVVCTLIEWINADESLRAFIDPIPLLQFPNAVHDIGRGLRAPLFEPLPPARHGKRMSECSILARAVCAVEALIKSGMKRKDAAWRVANAMNGGTGHTRITGADILQYRERISDCTAPETLIAMHKMYAAALERLEPKERAEIWLRTLHGEAKGLVKDSR